jgi:hypothetical protein
MPISQACGAPTTPWDDAIWADAREIAENNPATAARSNFVSFIA